MRWILLVSTVILMSLAVSGCRGHIWLGSPVVIKAGHKHTHSCGHYHHKGKWYHHAGHVHKHNCGHKKKGGIWIKVR